MIKTFKSRRMAKLLKPLKKQVMVITGASSGIGLVTARMAVKKDVRLVLAARNKDVLVMRKVSEALYAFSESQSPDWRKPD